MRWTRFPDPEKSTDRDGLVAIGGDLEPSTLVSAYRQGIFPWPIDGVPFVPWFCPPRRAILEFDSLHVPRRLERFVRNTTLKCTIDRDFLSVIRACQTIHRTGQSGTWITDAMESAYSRLHALGIAHSVEAWDEDGRLVGGLYGVDAGGGFSGESMFHRTPDASKLALLTLVEHLRATGLDFIDIQQLTPHMATLGAHEIPRSQFLSRWNRVLEAERTLFPVNPLCLQPTVGSAAV